MSKSRTTERPHLTHEQIVVLAAYLAGGDTSYVDTEDVAMATTKIAPGRFSWVKYKDQINIENVRRRLLDATREQSGGLITGSQRRGWLLTEAGLAFCEANDDRLQHPDVMRARLSRSGQSWVLRERVRMTREPAFLKWHGGKLTEVTAVEAERFFRIDDYMSGNERASCVARAAEAFRSDSNLEPAIAAISQLVRNLG
jgi:hypothetical protein